jgi:hypothetical protein
MFLSDILKSLSRATTGCEKYGGKGSNGGVWEWTSTIFDKVDGFVPSKLYPGYYLIFGLEVHSVDFLRIKVFHGLFRWETSSSGECVCDAVAQMLTMCSSWAARTQLSLEFPKEDPLETGISATILTHGLAVALYMTSSIN